MPSCICNVHHRPFETISLGKRQWVFRNKAKDFFNDAFFAALSAQIKQQEDWVLKLLALQIAIISFLLIGYVSPDAKLSFFGVELKGIQGSREVLLLFSSAIGTAISMLMGSRDAAVNMATAIVEQTTDHDLRPYRAFVAPSAFNMRVYIPREYDRWVFAVLPGRYFALLVAFALIVMALILIAGSLAVHWILIRDIWQHPGMGRWSTATLVFVGASYLINLIMLIRISFPLPYVDKGELKQHSSSAPT